MIGAASPNRNREDSLFAARSSIVASHHHEADGLDGGDILLGVRIAVRDIVHGYDRDDPHGPRVS